MPLCAALKETENVTMQCGLVPPSVQLMCAHNIHFNRLSTVLECSICVTFNRAMCFMVIKKDYIYLKHCFYFEKLLLKLI